MTYGAFPTPTQSVLLDVNNDNYIVFADMPVSLSETRLLQRPAFPCTTDGEKVEKKVLI
jgi:hypothetical protein